MAHHIANDPSLQLLHPLLVAPLLALAAPHLGFVEAAPEFLSDGCPVLVHPRLPIKSLENLQFQGIKLDPIDKVSWSPLEDLAVTFARPKQNSNKCG